MISEMMVVASIFVQRNKIWLLPYVTSGENKTKRPDNKPIEYSLIDIEQAIKEGELETGQLQLEDYKNVPEEHLTDSTGKKLPSTNERDRRFNIVKQALENEDELFYAPHGKSVIRQVATKNNVTVRNVQRYLNEYFRGGRHRNSLIPRTGRHKRTPFTLGKKLGTQRITASKGVIGKNVDADDVQKMRKVLQKYYLNKSQQSLDAVYQKLLDEEYAVVKGKFLPDGTRTQTLHAHPNQQISLNQFYHWIPEALGLSRHDINAVRRQTTTHKSNYAGRTGDGNYIALGPGHIFQMDSTEKDIKLVSPYDRRVILMKVTVYVVRDVFCRSYAGIHVASGKASWYEARLALLNTFRDKKTVAAECGLIIDDDDWIEGSIPQILLVDNEEFANKISESVGRDLGIIVQYSRAYSGDDKGLVESSFHMLHAMMRNQALAGFEYKGLVGRNRQLPINTAAITPRELQQILIIYAIYHNRSIWKEDYPMEQAAAQDGVKNICRDYWLWGLEYRGYFLRTKSPRTLYLSLLEVGELTVHRTHLMLKGKQLKYRCHDVRVSGLQNKIGGRGKQPTLSCRYIRSTVNKILIELNGEFVLGELDSDQQRYQNLSHAEFQVARLELAANKAMHHHDTRSQTSDAYLLISQINQKAIDARIQDHNELAETPQMDAKTATELQKSESHYRDNQHFEAYTQGLAGSEAAPKESINDGAAAADEDEHTIPNSHNSNDEGSQAADMVDSILQEINHG
jgi:hypothetical protein